MAHEYTPEMDVPLPYLPVGTKLRSLNVADKRQVTSYVCNDKVRNKLIICKVRIFTIL